MPGGAKRRVSDTGNVDEDGSAAKRSWIETANDVVDILPWVWVWAMMGLDLLPIPAVSLVAFLLSIVGVGIQYTLFKSGRVKIFPKIIDMGNVVVFSALLCLALTFTSKTLINWFDCLQNAAIFLLVAVPLSCDKPFTADFAKEKLPERVWEDPAFKSGNIAITFIWALALMVMTIASAVEPAIKQAGYETSLWLTIVFSYIGQIGPICLAMRYTIGYIQDHREEIDRITGDSERGGHETEKSPLHDEFEEERQQLALEEGSGRTPTGGNAAAC